MDIISKEMVRQYLPQRISTSHKGTYGRVGVICGSEEMPGAARLVIRAAYKTGAGLVCAFAGRSFAPYLKNDIPEAIIKIVSETPQGTFTSELTRENSADIDLCNTIVFGCGIGQNSELQQLAGELLLLQNKRMIIDADALNLLQGRGLILSQLRHCDVVITPHIKEMARLTGKDVSYILDHAEKTALDFAVNNQVVVVLKYHQTVVASPGGDIFINQTGNSALSKAGTGDVLSGMIAGFAAQNHDLWASSICAVYLHGLAAGFASGRMTEYAVSASDVIDHIPDAIGSVLNGFKSKGDE